MRSLSFLYDQYLELASASIAMSFVLSLYLYHPAFVLPQPCPLLQPFLH